MHPTTKKQFEQLLDVYKKARERIAAKMINYNWLPARELALLKVVDEQIIILEKETTVFLQASIPFEYEEEIKRAEKNLTKLWVEAIGIKNFTTIDKAAIDYIVTDLEARALMSVRWVRRGSVDFVSRVKQARIRELLAVSQIAGQWVRETAKEAAWIIRETWITAFLNRRWARLKLDTYIFWLIRNWIQEVHNTASYNRYVEAGIEVVQYSHIWDKKVSKICRPREWKYYKISWITPPPAGSHFNCRHNLEPIVRVPTNATVHETYPN